LSQSRGRQQAIAFHVLQIRKDAERRSRTLRKFAPGLTPRHSVLEFRRATEKGTAFIMAASFNLISPGTRVTANGDSGAIEVRGSKSRTFLCTLQITDQIEQESVDVSIWGSADG